MKTPEALSERDLSWWWRNAIWNYCGEIGVTTECFLLVSNLLENLLCLLYGFRSKIIRWRRI